MDLTHFPIDQQRCAIQIGSCKLNLKNDKKQKKLLNKTARYQETHNKSFTTTFFAFLEINISHCLIKLFNIFQTAALPISLNTNGQLPLHPYHSRQPTIHTPTT